MRTRHTRANVVTLTGTSQEIAALVSGARMALSLMTEDPKAPPEALRLASLLRRILADHDAGLARGRAAGTAAATQT